MHHIKSAAKQEAWNDPRNPFSKWRPNRNSTQSRLEEGEMTRTRTAPDSYGTENREESNRDNQMQRQFHTDPFASSRRREKEIGDSENALSKVTSPEDYEGSSPTTARNPQDQTEHDWTSTTEMPMNNEATASGFHGSADDEKHHRLHVPSFLGGKRDEVDANNSKDKKQEPHFTAWGQFRVVVLGSWVNILLIFSPIGIALHFAKVNDVAIFVVNFIAIIPLAGTLSYATEEIALRTGEVLGGLLNASFGNAVELIVSIVALFHNQFLIVQTSLLGSMLSNLLLVLGMAFFFGGFNRVEQAFNTTVAQTASSLLFLAVSSLIIPTAFEAWAQTGNDKTTTDQQLVTGVPQLSHATAVILLIIYASYLFFQLKSHVTMYTAPSQKNKTRFTEEQKHKWKKRTGVSKFQSVTGRRSSQTDYSPPTTAQNEQPEEEEEVQQETPSLSVPVAIFTLAASTVLVALNAEFIVDSLNAVTCSSDSGISKTFVGLILLPIVGNAAEHFTAVSVAVKDKMDLSIGVAVGSSLQIALLVLPLVVVIGWMAGKGEEMTLYFDGFQLAMLFVAILLVNYLIQDGKSHWLEGMLLMFLYIMIAVAAWFYPTSKKASGC